MADPRQGAGFGGVDDDTLPTTPSPTASEQRAADAFFVPGTQETLVGVGDSNDRYAKRRCESPPVGGGGPAEPSRLHHQHNIVADSLLSPEAASADVPIDTAPHSDLPTDSAGCTFVRDDEGHLHLKCDWSVQTGNMLWTLLISESLGPASGKGMTYFLREIVKCLSCASKTSADAKAFFLVILKQKKCFSGKAAGANKDFKVHFISAADSDIVKTREHCKEYVVVNPIYWHRAKVSVAKDRLNEDLLPAHGDVNSIARLLVLLVDSAAQPLWHGAANPETARASFDDKDLALAIVTERIEQKIMDDFFNNITYKAENSVSLSVYSPKFLIDPTKPPAVPKTVVWMRDQRNKMKRIMAACSTKYNASGNGAGGLGATDADTKFWYFCHQDLLVMFMWLCWQRGYNIPAHCTSALDACDQIDVGGLPLTPSVPAQKSPGKTGRGSEAHNIQLLQSNLLMTTQTSRTLLDIFQSRSSSETSQIQLQPPQDCMKLQLQQHNLTAFWPQIYLALGCCTLAQLARMTSEEVSLELEKKSQLPRLQRMDMVHVCDYAHHIAAQLVLPQ